MLNQYTENNHRDEAVALLALSCIKGVSFRTLYSLAKQERLFNDFLTVEYSEDAISRLNQHGAKITGNRSPSWSEAMKPLIETAELHFSELTRRGIHILTRMHPCFPKSLLDLGDAPYWLFVQGNIDVLNARSISVVGTRKPSKNGIWLTEFIGHCLHEFQCPTVSGLALGIDQAIHQASLEAKVPTIAVLGTGILSTYPKNAHSMRDKIIETGGAIITEYLPEETYSAQNFIRRNRLQAALGRALLPVEWNAKSGTAHTVRFATKLNRYIAFLAMPNWPEHNFQITTEFGNNRAQIFHIPGEESNFREYIKHALASDSNSSVSINQLNFLDGF